MSVHRFCKWAFESTIDVMAAQSVANKNKGNRLQIFIFPVKTSHIQTHLELS
jgi:hypothetical protein